MKNSKLKCFWSGLKGVMTFAIESCNNTLKIWTRKCCKFYYTYGLIKCATLSYFNTLNIYKNYTLFIRDNSVDNYANNLHSNKQ